MVKDERSTYSVREITDHFYESEFARKGYIITPIQRYMLLNLCNILEAIREFLSAEYKKDTPIAVRDGIRLPSDNNALRKKGYNPSETTDHFFGNIVKLHSRQKILRFGKYYPYSVGAADIVPKCGAYEAFDKMKSYFTRKTGIITLPNRHIRIGQMILEERNSCWIHVSNPPELIYSPDIVSAFLERPHFLKSDDNGKSYKVI